MRVRVRGSHLLRTAAPPPPGPAQRHRTRLLRDTDRRPLRQGWEGAAQPLLLPPDIGCSATHRREQLKETTPASRCSIFSPGVWKRVSARVLSTFLSPARPGSPTGGRALLPGLALALWKPPAGGGGGLGGAAGCPARELAAGPPRAGALWSAVDLVPCGCGLPLAAACWQGPGPEGTRAPLPPPPASRGVVPALGKLPLLRGFRLHPGHRLVLIISLSV